MSNPGNTNPFSTLVITGNPTIDALLRYALAALLTGAVGVIGGYLKREGFSDPHLLLLVSGALVTVIGAVVIWVWGVLSNAAQKVEAMNATLNLVAARKAIDTKGNVISTIMPNSTPPLPITKTTMPEIIKNFGTGTAKGA